MITPQTHPNLPWRRLVGGPYNYPWIVFAVTAGRSSAAVVHIFSERNGQGMSRPCNDTANSAKWPIWFAQHHGG